MTAYLVRLKAEHEHHPREIVGFFVAETMRDLYWMVDECAPPPECECIEIGSGGIYWEAFTGRQVPREAEPDWETLPKDWSPLPPGPALTDGWNDMLSASEGPIDEAWGPIEWAEEDEAPAAPSQLPPLPPRGRLRRR